MCVSGIFVISGSADLKTSGLVDKTTKINLLSFVDGDKASSELAGHFLDRGKK